MIISFFLNSVCPNDLNAILIEEILSVKKRSTVIIIGICSFASLTLTDDTTLLICPDTNPPDRIKMIVNMQINEMSILNNFFLLIINSPGLLRDPINFYTD
jgi:hypothetical protein